MLLARNIILISNILALFRIGCLVSANPTGQHNSNSNDQHYINSDNHQYSNNNDQHYSNSDDQHYSNSNDQHYNKTTDVIKESRPFNARDLKRSYDIHDAGGQQDRRGDAVSTSSEKSLSGVLQDPSVRAMSLEDKFNSSPSQEKSLEELLEDASMHASTIRDTAFSDLFLSSVSGTTPSPSTPSYSSFGISDQNDEITESLDHTKAIWSSTGQKIIPKFHLLTETTEAIATTETTATTETIASTEAIATTEAIASTEAIATTEVSMKNIPELHKVAPGSTEPDSLSPSHRLIGPYSYTESVPMNMLTVSTKSKAVTGISNTDKRENTDSKSVLEITSSPGKFNNVRASKSSFSDDTLSSSMIDASESPQTQVEESFIHSVNNSKSSFDDDMEEISTNGVTESLSDNVNTNISNMTVDQKKRSVNDFGSITIVPVFANDGLVDGTNLRTDVSKARYQLPEIHYHDIGGTPKGPYIQGGQNIKNLETPHPLLDKSLKSTTEDDHAISLDKDTVGFISLPNNSELEEDRHNYQKFSPSEPTLNEETTQQTSNTEYARPAMIVRRNKTKIENATTNFPPNDHIYVSPVHYVDAETEATNMNPLPTRVIPLVRETSPLPSVVEQLDTVNSKEISVFSPDDGQADQQYITQEPSPKPLPTRIIPLIRTTSPLPVIGNPAHSQNSTQNQPFNPNLRESDPVLETSIEKTPSFPTLVSPTRATGGGRNRPIGSGGSSDSSWDSSSVMVRTPVGEMNSRNVGLMVLVLMVVSTVLVVGLLTLAAYWIKAKIEVRRLDREMRTACIQGLDHGFVDQGL